MEGQVFGMETWEVVLFLIAVAGAVILAIWFAAPNKDSLLARTGDVAKVLTCTTLKTC